jgi:hypothetical protein
MLDERNAGRRGARGPAPRRETKIKTKINEIEKNGESRRWSRTDGGTERGISQNRHSGGLRRRWTTRRAINITRLDLSDAAAVGVACYERRERLLITPC